jgi:hypothetical protein
MTDRSRPRRIPLRGVGRRQPLRAGTAIPGPPPAYHPKRGRLSAGQFPLARATRTDVLDSAVTVQPLDG